MELYYCDACGLRISPAELSGQTSASADGKFWCAKCKPSPVAAAGKSPVRGSQTLIPVRQPSSAHVPSAPPRKSGPAHAGPGTPKNNWILPATGGAVAILLGAIVFGSSGGSTTRPPAATSAPDSERAPPRNTSSTTVSPPIASPTVQRNEPPRDTALAPPTTDPREDAAQKAFDKLTHELKDSTATDRIAALEVFITKYDGAIVASRARTQLTELKAALPAPPSTPVAAVEPEKAAIPPAKVETQPATPVIAATSGQGGEGKQAPADKPTAEADTASRAAYSAFLERFWNALSKRDRVGAASFLSQAGNDAALKQKSSELEEERSVLKLYDDFLTAVPKGLLKVNELDYFELQRGKTGVIKLGKRGEFQVASVKDGAINLGANGVSMAVPLDALSLSTWINLAEIDGKGGPPRGDQALFFKLLSAAPDSIDASKLRSQIAALDAKTSPALLGAFSRRVNALEESAAAVAFTKLEKTAEAHDRAALAAVLAAFKRSYGATDIAVQKVAALKVFELNSGPILVVDGLVCYFPLDENAGKSSKNAINGAPDLQIANCNWVPGKFGSGLSFDGAASSATFNSIAVKFSAITLSIWVKHRQPPTDRYDRYLWLSGDGAIIRRERQGKLQIVFRINGALESIDGDPIDNTRWHHVAATFDGQDVKLYHDGTLVVSVPKPGALSVNTDGTLSCPTEEFMAGTLDDARIYNRALNAAEIKQLADQKNARE